MKSVRLRFKDFEFSANPGCVKVSVGRKIKSSALTDKKSTVESICLNPTVISGSGAFYGDGAQEKCVYLHRLFKEESPGWLYCPGAPPVKAYFSGLEYELDSSKDGAFYSFEFTQAQSTAEIFYDCGYTYAEEGENAFDIAGRSGISVSTLMKLNMPETVFGIRQGERIRIK